MSTRFNNACKGKSESQGGMNMPEIVRMAKSLGDSGVGTRTEVLKRICNKKTSSGIATTTPKRVRSTSPPKKRVVRRKLVADEAVAPKLPYGEVGRRTGSWTTRKPKSVGDRRKLLSSCGEKCFLSPEELKYPICATDGDCRVDCDGLRAARNLASLVKNRKTVSRQATQRAERAHTLAGTIGRRQCNWS